MALQITVLNNNLVYINCKLKITVKLSKKDFLKDFLSGSFYLFIYLSVYLLFIYIMVIELSGVQFDMKSYA